MEEWIASYRYCSNELLSGLAINLRQEFEVTPTEFSHEKHKSREGVSASFFATFVLFRGQKIPWQNDAAHNEFLDPTPACRNDRPPRPS